MTTPDIVYFDGACGLCRRSSRIISALDWFNRIEARDMLRVPEDELPYPIEVAMEGMPMRTRDGRALLGFEAVRRALMQTPLGALVVWMLYIPGLSHIGRRAYRRIASNRARDVCATNARASQ